MPRAEIHDPVEKARQLLDEGNATAAYRLLQDAAAKGELRAMIELARLARKEGKVEESNEWILLAENTLQPGDWEGRLVLSSAYNLALGSGTRSEQEKRSLQLLLEVAAAGNTRVQEDVALQFLYGLNGCVEDETQFEYWIGRAVARGSARAVYIHAKHLFERRQPIPNKYIEVLEHSKSENKSAEKLLRAIAVSAKRKTN